ncbi:MAG: hypothetical protein HC799_18910 [Limnothrix sp. RL_2_0]|nr:hypothetical protein [Limnothrix sp. RL_2_0]
MFRESQRDKLAKSKPQADGFTLIEVLAGILMSTAFVLITTQAIAISAVFRVRAQRESEALMKIQENLEDIKFDSLKALSATCGDAATQSTGYGQALINSITTPADSVITLLNKSYSMTRTLAVYNTSPYNAITISYSVADPTSGNVIADLYTEMIPDAAFECN